MSNRIVRNLCIELARASTWRVERLALLAIAHFAECDEAWERVNSAPDPEKTAALKGVDDRMGEMVDIIRAAMNPQSTKSPAPKPGREN